MHTMSTHYPAIYMPTEKLKTMRTVVRQIKAKLAMLVDPDFEDLGELKTTLAGSKAKRDKVQKALEKARPSSPTKWEAPALREWALRRLEALEEVSKNQPDIVKGRKLVHSAAEKIEIDPLAGSRCGQPVLLPARRSNRANVKPGGRLGNLGRRSGDGGEPAGS